MEMMGGVEGCKGEILQFNFPIAFFLVDEIPPQETIWIVTGVV